MDFNPANQQLLRYHFLNETMLLDMIQKQVQNNMQNYIASSGTTGHFGWLNMLPMNNLMRASCKTAHTW